MVLPHPTIPLHSIRPTDVGFILFLAASVEGVFRTWLSWQTHRSATKMAPLVQRTSALRLVVAQKRALGPSAFVETSKLERVLLSEEMELERRKEQRASARERTRAWHEKCTRIVTVLVFVVYWGLPLLSSSSLFLEEEQESSSSSSLREMLFPLPYTGIGFRLSQWGMESSSIIGENSISSGSSGLGALVVFWAGQVTAGELIDGVLALVVSTT